MHILPAVGLWEEVNDRGTVKSFFPIKVSLSEAERIVFAGANRTAAAETCTINKAAGRKWTTLKPFFFYLWWLQAVLGGTLLFHSSWHLMRCRGLEVSAGSHFYLRVWFISVATWGHLPPIPAGRWCVFIQLRVWRWERELFRSCPPNGLCCWCGFLLQLGIRIQPC